MIALKTFSIFLISLILIQSSYAEDSVYLNKGESAPFSGYLLPEATVKTLRNNTIERDGFKLINDSLERSIVLYKNNETLFQDQRKILVEQNDNLAKSLESARSTSDLTKILWFGLGVVAAGLGVYGAKKVSQ